MAANLRTSSIQVDLRDAVYNAISTEKANTAYTRNDFDLSQGYYQETELETLDNPFVSVHSQGLSTDEISRGADDWQDDIVVGVGLQSRVDVYDTAAMDQLMLLFEQLMDTAQVDNLTGKCQWMETAVVPGSNGLMFDLQQMRERSAFEVYFAATYRRVV